MKKLFLIVILGAILASCSSAPKEKTLVVDELEIPYSMVEQSIDLDDAMSLDLFLDSGFNPNYKNDNGETLLMQIVKNNSLKSLDVLLKYKINLEEETPLKQRIGTTIYEPQKRAIDFVKSRSMLNKLIKAGVDLNYKDNLGEPVIIKFIKTKPDSYIIDLINNEKIEIDIQDSDKWTPLMWATSKRNLEIMEVLIKKGANQNIIDDRGNPALYYAYGEKVQALLITEKFDKNLENNDGEKVFGEAYLRAISNSHYEVVKKIIKLGGDKNYSSYGDTPLGIAKENNNQKMTKLLLELGVEK